MSTTVTRPQHKLLSLTLVLLLATTACSQAVSSQVATPATATSIPTTTTAATNGYQLQILKNCEFVKQRPLSSDEIALYQKLKDAEQKMTALQAPLELMEQQLEAQTKLLESMSAQIEQQAQQQGEPDPVLLETQAELSQQISAIVDSFEPDIDAVSANGDQIGVIADEFTTLLTKDSPAGSYDQIRIIGPGEQSTKDCNNGMFFHKSFSVKSLKAMKAAD